MVFSTDTIINSKDIKLSNPILDDDDEFDKSLFSEALDIIADEQYRFFKETNELLDEGIVSNMIMNKFKAIDINELIVKIFDGFIKALETLNNSFNAFLLNFINKNVELKAAKNKLSSYTGSIRYDKPYYIYKNLESDSSCIDTYKYYINNVYNNMLNGLNNISLFSNKDDILKAFNDIQYNLDNSYSLELEDVRRSIIGTSKDIPESSFSEELFNHFRHVLVEPNTNNDNDNIDNNRIRVALNDYYKSNKQIAIIKRDQMKFRAESIAAKSKVKGITISNFIKNRENSIDPEIILSYNKLSNSTCKEIQKICNTYLMFFGAKLDALKEYTITNRNILFLTLQRQVKEGL